MNLPLQQFDLSHSSYERPDQRWICGHAAEGKACPLGPSLLGRCRATGECEPSKKGDRWFCTRAAHQGGPCSQGPLPDGRCCHPIAPCQPVRSFRARRGLWTLSVTALTLGFVLAVFAGKKPQRWIDPGPLSAPHGWISTQSDSCATCHAAPTGGPVQSAGMGSAAAGPVRSELCLKCHQKEGLFGPHALSAHGLDAALLKTTASSRPQQAAYACSVCHKEHHGRENRLALMSDTRCQSCHAVRFDSFQHGHPPFRDYPAAAARSIAFNHNSHLTKHFAQKKADINCQDCHRSSLAGRNVPITGYAQNCASCHDQPLQASFDKGLALFQLPGIDTEILAEKSIHVGQWPGEATIDIDGQVNPFMKRLLSADPKAAAAMKLLGSKPLNDESLESADTQTLRAVGDLAWGVKTLMYELATQGPDALRPRLEKTLNRRLSDQELAELTGRLPADLITAAQQKWFPDLMGEIPAYQSGQWKPRPSEPKPQPPKKESEKPKPSDDSGDLLEPEKPAPKPKPNDDGDLLSSRNGLNLCKEDDLLSDDPKAGKAAPTAQTSQPPQAAKQSLPAAGWRLDGPAFAIRYLPGGHADPFLKAWIDLLAQDADAAKEQGLYTKLTEPTAPGLCAKCHQSSHRGLFWKNPGLAAPARTFTQFNHQPHLLLPSTDRCTQCHAPAKEPPAKAAGTLAGDFKPMAKSLCLQCHTPSAAGQSCLQCHPYHIQLQGQMTAGKNDVH